MQALPVALTLTGKARGRKRDTDLGTPVLTGPAGLEQASELPGLGDGPRLVVSEGEEDEQA